jgi:hypothetical protein
LKDLALLLLCEEPREPKELLPQRIRSVQPVGFCAEKMDIVRSLVVLVAELLCWGE